MSKVMIIGIDGASFDLIKQWSKKGLLPNITALMKEGAYGNLQSTPLPLTAPSWSSFMTGMNPGKHGVYDFIEVTPDYKTITTDFNDIMTKTVFEIVSDSNRRIVSINVPNTYPPFKVNGYLISGIPAHSRSSDFTYPPDLKNDLDSYTILPEKVYEGNNEDVIIDELNNMIETRLEVAKKLIKKDWDLFMVVFYESDVVGHWFWKHMDKIHPSHRPDDGRYKDAILKIYQKIDGAVGELIKFKDEDTYLIVMSDHGMGPVYKNFYINNWLLEKGYLKLKNRAVTKMKYFLHKRGWTLENALTIVKKLKVAKYTQKASEKERRFLLNFFLSIADIDWSKTKAYSLTNFAPLYINAKGQEYEKLRKTIAKEMSEIRDDEGEKVIDKIFFKEEVFSGDHLDKAPDIIYYPTKMRYHTARYFEFGSNKLFGVPAGGMSGTHRMEGIFIYSGEDIKKDFEISADIVDVVPTALHLMDIPVPHDMDGKVLKDIFTSDSKQYKKQVKYSKSKQKKPCEKEWSKSEEESIKKKLRNLGYQA